MTESTYPIHIHCILQSVIQLINQTSQGFREGKKWKCNSRCGTRSYTSTNRTFRDRLASQKTNTCRCKRICSQCDISDVENEDSAMLSHSKTLDHSDCTRSKRPRQLVRQLATENQLKSAENRGNQPCRQWTTDASFSETDPEPSQNMKSKATSSPMVMSSNSNAFLLRPLSRNSTNPTKENQPADLQSPAVKAAIAAAVAAAKGPKGTSPSDHLSMNSYGPEIRSAPNGTIHQSRLRKQRTTESAPTNNHILVGGHIIRQIPRQQSNASAYSMAIPSTYSHQGITLVRGASCSLVDIPTYLGPITTGGMVEVAGKSKGSSAGALTQFGPGGRPLQHRPRLQLDLTKNNQKSHKNAKSTRKTKWTILCVGLTLLTMCVTLVGTMLSIGSQYEGMRVHRKWENEIGPGLTSVIANQSTNHSLTTEKERKETTSMSPLMSILKIAKNEDTNLVEDTDKVSSSHDSSVTVKQSTDQQKDRKKKLFGGKSFSRGRVNTVVKKTVAKNTEDDFPDRWYHNS